MKIHEYQAKAMLAQYHVPVPRGEVAFTVEEAEAAAQKIGEFPQPDRRTFDPIGAAESAAALSVGLILNPERAARLVQYHAEDSQARVRLWPHRSSALWVQSCYTI